MFYVTRVKRKDSGEIIRLWVKDSIDGEEECLYKQEVDYCMDKGIEISGLNRYFADPKPICDPKWKMLKNVDVEISKDGSEVQYIKTSTMGIDLGELPPLGDCSVDGRCSYFECSGDYDINIKAFYNQLRDEYDVSSKEYALTAYATKLATSRYSAVLNISKLNDDKALKFYNSTNAYWKKTFLSIVDQGRIGIVGKIRESRALKHYYNLVWVIDRTVCKDDFAPDHNKRIGKILEMFASDLIYLPDQERDEMINAYNVSKRYSAETSVYYCFKYLVGDKSVPWNVYARCKDVVHELGEKWLYPYQHICNLIDFREIGYKSTKFANSLNSFARRYIQIYESNA